MTYGEEMDDDQHSMKVYRWTIRGLYLTALVLNAWVLWDQVKDSPEGVMIRTRAQVVADRVMAPVRDQQMFRKAANAVVFEAVTIVEESHHDD